MTATIFRQSYMTQRPSLFTLINYCAIVFSFALMFANGWFTACDGFYDAFPCWLVIWNNKPLTTDFVHLCGRGVHGLDFWTSWIWTPVASNRIRSELLFPVAGSRIGFGFCFYWKKYYCLFAWFIYTRTQIGVGLLESSWYRIRVGFGFAICKIGLEPDSKKSESEHLYHRDERTVKFFSPSPILIRKSWIQSRPDLQNFWILSVRSSPDPPI